MIEKLKEHDIIDPKTNKVIGKIGCDLREIMDKLNELVDTVNELQYDNSEKVNCQGSVQDRFVEQRKWIGKLCRCWDSDINDDTWGILQDIKDNKTEKYYLYGIGYEYCEPVKPDDDIIYKGE